MLVVMVIVVYSDMEDVKKMFKLKFKKKYLEKDLIIMV